VTAVIQDAFVLDRFDRFAPAAPIDLTRFDPPGHGSTGRRHMVVRSLDDARDREMVRRVVAGDEGAFRDLFRRYGPMAKSLALRVVRQAHLAEEIVQEAFLALWREPGSYHEDRGSVRSWLLAAVHHRAVDTVRREESQRRRTQAAAPEIEDLPDVGQQVVEETYAARSRQRVRQALQEIPEEQRRVLDLMYFQGKSQSTIATELSLPLGTVKSRALLAMRRLRAMLAEEDE
jgi:RNA polymerase sigma-70 factor (ECF subfamily)